MKSANKILSYTSQILYAEESTVYIIPNKLAHIGVGKNRIEQLLQKVVDTGFQYKICQKHDLPAEIAGSCSNLKTSVIFAYFLPDVGDYVYYIVNLSAINDAILQNTLNNIKNCTFESRRNALINLAYNNPELLEEVIRSRIEFNERFSERHDTCCQCIRPSETQFKEPIFRGRRSSKESDEVSLKEMATLMKRFLHNVKKFKEDNDPNAKKEIDIILNNSIGISDKLWETVFSPMLSNKSQKEFFKVCIDRYTLGKRSTMKVEVKKEDNENILNETHGKYYVTLKQETSKKEITLNFDNQPTAVIYIMYLIDRKQKGNKVERINLQNNMETFKRLYNLIYGEHVSPPRIESHLKNIINEEVEENGRRIMKTGRLRLYYNDISNILDEKIVPPENPLPYKVNAQTHLTIPKDSITIPKELEDFKFI